MSKHLSANLDFISSFVAECYAKGFNEKQASELLSTYTKGELYRCDKNFREGLDGALKQAGTVPQALWQLAKATGKSIKGKPGIFSPIGAGIAAGAAAPAGIIPEDYMGGAGAGAGVGAILGALATRGRGLGGGLRSLGKAVQKGGVGRTLAGQAGKVLTNKSIVKNTGKGLLGGLAASGTVNALNSGSLGSLGRYPNMDPNTEVPWYMRGGGQAGAAPTSAVSNPYELAPEIMSRVSGGGAGVGAAGAAMGGPIQQIQAQRAEIVNLNNTINELERGLPVVNNPSAYAQRQHIQSQVDNLKMRRNALTSAIMQAENQVNADKYNILDAAAQRTMTATSGLQNAQEEFENLQRMQQLAGQGGITGGLMGLYNRITGTAGRLKQLDPIYSGYQQQLEEARRMQQLAQ